MVKRSGDSAAQRVSNWEFQGTTGMTVKGLLHNVIF